MTDMALTFPFTRADVFSPHTRQMFEVFSPAHRAFPRTPVGVALSLRPARSTFLPFDGLGHSFIRKGWKRLCSYDKLDEAEQALAARPCLALLNDKRPQWRAQAALKPREKKLPSDAVVRIYAIRGGILIEHDGLFPDTQGDSQEALSEGLTQCFVGHVDEALSNHQALEVMSGLTEILSWRAALMTGQARLHNPNPAIEAWRRSPIHPTLLL